MKYIEYVYLAASVILLGVLVKGGNEFSNVQNVMIVISMVLTSFMFSFRRRQRMAMERIEKERIRKLEEEAAK